MPNQIVKEILLKFRGDTKPLERDMKNVEKAGQSLQKTISGYGGGTSITGMNKAMDSFIKNQQKFGMTINKDMTKFQKTIQDVATKDLRTLQRQTDDLFQKSQQKLNQLRTAEQNYERMRSQGASASRVQKQRRKVARYGVESRMADDEFVSSTNQFESAAEGLNETLPQKPSWRSRARMGMNVVGSAAALVGGVANASFRISDAQEQSRAILSSTLKQRRMEAFTGDLTEAMLERKDKITSQSTAFAKSQIRKKDIAWGAAAAGGLMAIGGALLAPVSGGTSLLMSGAGAAMLTGAGVHMFGRAGEEEQIRQDQARRLKSQTMTDVFYNHLREKAPARYQFQRQMAMGDTGLNSLLQSGFRNNFTEEEALNTGLAFRQQFGNAMAPGMATGAMSMARRQGISLQAATGMMGSAGMTGINGPGGAKKTLEDVYSNAFSRGIVDSGLLETFQKGMLEVANASPDKVDLAGMAAAMASSLGVATTGRDIGARDIQGAIGAANVLGGISVQGGEAGFAKMSNLADITGGNEGAMALLAGKTDQEILSMAKNDDPRLKRVPGLKDKILSKMSASSTAGRMALGTTRGKAMIREIQTRMNKGEALSDLAAEFSGEFQNLTGTGGSSLEVATQALSQTLTDMGKNNPQFQGALNKGRAGDASKSRAAVDKAIKAGDVGFLTRQYAADVESGGDTSYMDKLDPRMRDQIIGGVAAGRNRRSSLDAGTQTRAGAQVTGTAEGQAALTEKALENVSIEDIRATAAAQRTTVGPSADLASSTDNLKSALDAFVRSVEANSGSSASSTSSGGD